MNAVRGLLVLIVLGVGGLLLVPLPVLAQEITDAFVRGTDVALRAEPAADADLVTTLQLGDAIRITGNAETESGETKPVTVDTLGVTRVWFVPIEVVETGEAGWIAEVFIDPRRLNETVSTTPSAPENTPDATVVLVPTATPVPTAIPTSTATQPTQPQGAVDQAKERDEPGCFDGIGSTYTLEQEQNADDDNDLGEFYFDREACAWKEETPIILALCSPPVEDLKDEAAIVVCNVTIVNPEEGDAVMVSAHDFSLLANSARYEADIEVSKQGDPLVDIASEPLKVRAGDNAEVVVAFDVPAQVAKEDLLLVWTGFGEIETDNGVLPGLQIIVDDREPAVAEVILPDAPAATPAGQTTATSSDAVATAGNVYQGRSDDVIGPLDLPPGLYQVTSRYSGDENFVIWVRQGDGSSDLLVNEIGSYSGESTFSVEISTQVVIEVEGIGPWELQIEKLM